MIKKLIYSALFLTCVLFDGCKKDKLPSIPKLSTATPVIDLSKNFVNLSGTVIDEGGSAVTKRGFVWSKSTNPTVNDSYTENEFGIGTFTHTLVDLELSTTFYVRAYATNAIGTSYGNEVTFKTLSLGQVATGVPTNITNSGANVSISVNEFGDANVIKIGLVCSKTSDKPISNDSTNYIHNNTTDKDFTITISKLEQNQTYFVRGFVQTGAGVSYGNEISFTTLGVATLNPITIENITQTSATAKSGLLNNGGVGTDEVGICLSTNQNPTINDRKFPSNNLSNGLFSSGITGLVGNTLYYIRPYAINRYGTNYGSQSSFKSAPILPTVVTGGLTGIISTSLTASANITDGGGAPISSRGFVWSKNRNPTIESNAKVSTGSGTGSYSAKVAGLLPKASYFIRAYATNSVGTSYGSEQTFTTPDGGITVAGGNGYGSNSNQLIRPTGIFVTKNGDVYVADPDNHRVQKWAEGSLSGVTVAGGNGNGPLPNQLSGPAGIFVDDNNNLYIVDAGNNRVQKWAQWDNSGITVAGGYGQGAAANQFYFPSGIYLDSNDNLYIADAGNDRIQKWSNGATTGITVAGGNGKGSLANQLSGPFGVFVDASGAIYVADTGNDRIQKWAPGATSGTTVAGGNGAGIQSNKLNAPYGVFVDGGGSIYISDTDNHRIQKWLPGASIGATVAGGNGYGESYNQLYFPKFVFIDDNRDIYISDNFNHRVQKWLK